MQRLTLIAVSLLALGTAHADSPVRDARTGFVGYVASAGVPLKDFARWPGTRARLLSEDPVSGRLAVQVEIPPQWRGTRLASLPQSMELIVLGGTLRFGATQLERWDFAFVPPATRPPPHPPARPARVSLSGRHRRKRPWPTTPARLPGPG